MIQGTENSIRSLRAELRRIDAMALARSRIE
jgi:hypothetical protein